MTGTAAPPTPPPAGPPPAGPPTAGPPTAGPPPVRARRTAFAGAMVALALCGDSYLYATLPLYYPEAGVSLMAVGWLLSVNRYIRIATNPLAGMIGGRWGWSAPFAGAMWLAAATTAAYGLARGVWVLLAARALWGLSWSFLRLGGMEAVLAEAAPGRHGRLMGVFTGIFRLGSLAGVVAGGLLADRTGFAATALAFAAVTAAGAAVATLPPALRGRWGAPARPESEAAAPDAAAPAAVPDAAPRAAPGAPAAAGGWRRWLPAGRAEWAACLGAAAVHMVVSGVVTGTISLLVRERLGPAVAIGPWLLGAASAAGLLLGARWVLDLLVGPAAGHLSDLYGRRRVLAGAVAMLALGLAGLGGAGSGAGIALWATLLFAAGTGAAVVLDSRAGDLAHRAPGRFLPTYNTWLDLGAATGPVLGYAAAARFGLGAVYLGAAGAVLLAWLAQVRLDRR